MADKLLDVYSISLVAYQAWLVTEIESTRRGSRVKEFKSKPNLPPRRCLEMSSPPTRQIPTGSSSDEQHIGGSNSSDDEHHLLSQSSNASSSEEDLIVASNPDISVSSRAALPSITTPNLVNPTPRTPNRVRFALDDDSAEDVIELIEPAEEDEMRWTNEEDYVHSDDETAGRAPLLTRIAAPSVVVANDLDANELLGTDRPKSGGFYAFMNMANSIIGAGIIGKFSSVYYTLAMTEANFLGVCRTTVCVPASWTRRWYLLAGVLDDRCA